MDKERYNELVNNIHTERTSLSTRKSQDYANEDYLSNFKRVHTVAKIMDVDPRRSPADYGLFMVIMKLDRWTNLRSKGAEPQNESFLDTIYDLHNYVDLAYACEWECYTTIE